MSEQTQPTGQEAAQSQQDNNDAARATALTLNVTTPTITPTDTNPANTSTVNISTVNTSSSAAGNNPSNDGVTQPTRPSSSISESGSVSTSTTSPLSSPSFTHSTTSGLQGSLIPTSSSAASTPDTNHASSSISEGGLAGAIVGSIAGTFLLTLLGTILFLRRRRNNKSHTEAKGGRTTTSGPVKGLGQIYTQPTYSSLPSAKKVAPPAQSVSVGAQYLDLSSYVPQPADDGTTASRIQTLFDKASLHIDNYYSTDSPRLRLSQGGVSPLSIDHYESAFLPAPLAVILSKPRAGRAVLTHVLVRALLQGIQPGQHTECLLPTPYASGLSVNTNNDENRPVFAWRMLTAYLHRTERPAQNSPELAPPEDVIESLAERFSTTFASYGGSQFSDSGRLAHLTSVFRAASDLGVWLFSHPCTFDFRWDIDSIPLGHVIIFPAVVKVSDEFGLRLSAPQMLVERTVARV
ncbi:uncharacterized protein KD926_000856 [Aspergillus affinis]|uniref:uncharacterized protein n=1 Tax=Aspergillus affinis TaxID=1070780 RepID=UPI0022FE6AFC|nr:uncharacterized protein KD926_000856 [Aspergillus affinis]KAI9037070.1 hypothetical protein KD926_000856 [Aspergillus affinis]